MVNVTRKCESSLFLVQQDTGTSKRGKLCSVKKASRRKLKLENETDDSNTSYQAIITEK